MFGTRYDRRRFLRLAGGAGVGIGVTMAWPRPSTASAQAMAAVQVECPILTYHEVRSAAGFARQITGYLERGFQPVSLGTLRQLLAGEAVALSGRPFLITFDDGLRSPWLHAVPFLREWQVPAVFAVMPDWRGDRVHSYMTSDELRALVHDYGLEVISHTLNHANLVRERARNHGGWQAEIVESRARLEAIVGDGYVVEGFCYPFGAYDRPTVELVGQHYAVALSTRRGTAQRADEGLVLRRTAVS